MLMVKFRLCQKFHYFHSIRYFLKFHSIRLDPARLKFRLFRSVLERLVALVNLVVRSVPEVPVGPVHLKFRSSLKIRHLLVDLVDLVVPAVRCCLVVLVVLVVPVDLELRSFRSYLQFR
jgi:hypothetical protein